MNLNEKENTKPERTPATQLKVGVTVFTKNGKTSGNGIVTGSTQDDTGKQIWEIATEFGGKATFTEEQIYEKFELGFEHDTGQWLGERLSKVLKAAGYHFLTKSPNRDLAEKVFRTAVDEFKAEQTLLAAKRENLKRALPKEKPKTKSKPKSNSGALPKVTSKDELFKHVFGSVKRQS